MPGQTPVITNLQGTIGISLECGNLDYLTKMSLVTTNKEGSELVRIGIGFFSKKSFGVVGDIF